MRSDGNWTTLYDRAWALLELNRPDEAIPVFTQALEQEPQAPYLLCGISCAFGQKEEWKTALAYAERAIVADPEEEWGHRQRSGCLRALGRNAEALESAREAVNLEPEDESCLGQLVSVLLTCGQLAEAEQTALTLLEIAPDDADTHITLGLVYLKQERYPEAAASNHKALTLDPNNAHAFNNLGVALARQGRHEEALERYYQALKVDPSEKRTLDNLQQQAEANGFASLEEYLQARSDETLRDQVGKRAALKRQAKAFLAHNEALLALPLLRQALRFAPNDLSVLDMLAEAYILQGDLISALRHADRMIELRPDDHRGHWRRGALMSARAEKERDSGRKTKMRQEALKSVEEAVRLAPEDPNCLQKLAAIQLDFDLEAAEATAKRLIALAPEWEIAYMTMAAVYYEQKRWILAEMYFRRTLEIAPDNVTARGNMMRSLWQQGKKQDSLKCLYESMKTLYRDSFKR